MAVEWREIAARAASELAVTGMDLVHPFQVAHYNEEVGPDFALPDFGRSSALGLVIGSSRALWPHFMKALRAEPERLDDENPFDTFVGEAILEVLRRLPVRWEVRWYYELPPRRVAVQRLVHLSGLAYLSVSHFNIHPTFGPWIGFSGAAVFDLEGPEGPPPVPVNPCSTCDVTCEPEFRRAVASAEGRPLIRQEIIDHWRTWVRVRDACPVGREHRYSEDQLRYHYTKDREFLRRLLERS